MEEIALVAPDATAGQRSQPVHVVQNDIRRGAVGHAVVHPSDEPPEAGRVPRFVVVHLPPGRAVKTVLHDEAAQPIVGRLPEQRPVGQLRLDQRRHLRAVLVQCRAMDQLAPACGQKDDVRLKSVEGRIGVEDFLAIDAVVGLEDLRLSAHRKEGQFDRLRELAW